MSENRRKNSTKHKIGIHVIWRNMVFCTGVVMDEQITGEVWCCNEQTADNPMTRRKKGPTPELAQIT